MEGRQIGRYRITGEIGRGAMGIVYAALDPVIGRRVAIKTIHLTGLRENASTQDLRERLYREAQAAGTLNHPGIITIHDIGGERDEAYIVMEFVDGRTLEEMFASAAPQDTSGLLDVLRKTAEALDYAHARGIVHRDIKPSNIMVTQDGRVKVADFGIAKFSASTMTMTHTGFVLGTPNYMSPEQAQARPFDGRSDQFSLAVVAYRGLTGKLPFDGPTLTAVLSKLLWEQPEFSQAELPPAFRDVLSRALAKDPAGRYGTCVEFARALDKAFAQATTAAFAAQGENTTESDVGARTFIMLPADPAAQDGALRSAGPTPAAGNEEETATNVTYSPPVSLPAAAPAPKQAPEEVGPRRIARAPIAAVSAVTAIAALLAGYVFLWRRPPSQPSETTVQIAAPAPAPQPEAPKPAARPASDAVAPEPPATVRAQPGAPERQAVRTPAKKVSKPITTPAPPPGAAPPPASAQTEEPVPAPVVTQPPAATKPGAPATGTVTWTGRMQKNSVLVITGGKASFGVVAGMLPGIPIKVEVQPATLQVREPPGAENAWKQLMLYSGSDRYTSIVIRWTALQ